MKKSTLAPALVTLISLSLCSCPHPSSSSTTINRMPSGVGQNLWNIMWDGWENYYVSGINWTTVQNPWNPVFLNDLSLFKGAIRFMDWDGGNSNPIIHWQDRAPKTGDHYSYAYYPTGFSMRIDPSIQKYFTESENADGVYTFWGVAYEWMIDLCNRTKRDMWVCVPTFADDDYCTQLARLINSKLDQERKLYLEYSNETWNGMFKAFDYHMDKAAELNLPGENQWYKGGAYSVLRSLQIFKLFQDVFGEENTGVRGRLVRCLCSGGNEDVSGTAIRNIIYDGTVTTDYTNVPYNTLYNPYKQKPDVYALAPYAGGNIDGAASNAAALFRSDLNTTISHIDDFINSVINKYHFPLVSYEGGQHVLVNADVFSRNPAIYSEYLNYMDTWRSKNFIMFVHYTLYGKWDSGGAWGAKEFGTSTLEESHKFRALADWQAAHP